MWTLVQLNVAVRGRKWTDAVESAMERDFNDRCHFHLETWRQNR